MSLDHLELLAADIADFVDALAAGPADAPIAGCPGWTLLDLGVHLGSVHRWARGAIITGAVPTADPDDPPPTKLAEVATWVRAGGDRLLATLHGIDPSQPTWHPFPVEPKVAGLWRRRQAQEASVHRWDAQRAIGMEAAIETAFAADGIDEYWTVMLPRLIMRESRAVPSSVVAVCTTDTGQRWVVDGRGGSVALAAEGVQPAAEIAGDAQSLLLRLWGRPIRQGSLATRGDEAVAGDWLALGGA